MAAIDQHSPRVAEAWARSQALLEGSLDRREASAWSLAVRLQHQPAGRLNLGHARAWRPMGPVPSDLAPVAEPEPLCAEHIFDWASLTKAVGGQLLAMQLVARGQLSLSARVAAYLPSLAATLPDLTVDHLLRYTTGWPAWRPFYALAEPGVPLAGQLPALLAALPSEAPPGTRRLYSDCGHMALGAVITAITGESLAARFAACVAAPLGLRRTGYLPAMALTAPAVATSHGNIYERRMCREANFGMPAASKGFGPHGYLWDRFRAGTIIGEVDDGNAHYLLGGVSAHAGLFGPSDELAVLAEAAAMPTAGGERLGLGAEDLQPFVSLDAAGHLPTWWHGHELGFTDLLSPAANAPAPAVMLRGFCGTMVYVEPRKQLTVAMLSNREHVNGHGNYTNLKQVLHDVVAVWRSL